MFTFVLLAFAWTAVQVLLLYYPFSLDVTFFFFGPFPYTEASWISKLRGEMSLATFLNFLDAAVYLLFQCCAVIGLWHCVHGYVLEMWFLGDLWWSSCVQLLMSQYYFRQGKLLKAVGLRTIQAFLSVLLPPLEYVYTVSNLFSYFRKAQPVLNFTH